MAPVQKEAMLQHQTLPFAFGMSAISKAVTGNTVVILTSPLWVDRLVSQPAGGMDSRTNEWFVGSRSVGHLEAFFFQTLVRFLDGGGGATYYPGGLWLTWWCGLLKPPYLARL